MSDVETALAQLKAVPPKVVAVVGNPGEVLGAKYLVSLAYLPLGSSCSSRAGIPFALFWIDGWKLLYSTTPLPQITYPKPVVARLASSAELLADRVKLDIRTGQYDAVGSIEDWTERNQSSLAAAIADINSKSGTGGHMRCEP